MEKGDKPKKAKQKKPKDKKPKDKKPAKSTFSTTKSGLKKKTGGKKEGVVGASLATVLTSFPAKQKQENVQIVKVNVNTSKEEKPPLMKPVRKEITKQTTYVTLDKPYALQPEEEELLTITKFIPNPPRDKSSAKVTTLVSNPKNEIPQANIQQEPLASLSQIPVPIKNPSAMLKKKKEPKYDVPTEIFEPKKKTLAKTTEEEQPLVTMTALLEVTTKEIIPVTNSSTIDKSIQNSSINNNEKVQNIKSTFKKTGGKKEGVVGETSFPAKQPSLEEQVYDYITNTDDANISNPNSGEKINIQNENELQEEFGLSSAQLSSYKEEYTMKPKGTIQGLLEEIEKKSSRGRPVKYTSEEERLQAIKEQKKASALRKKAIKQSQVDIEYEKFIQGDYPPISLEEMIQKDIMQMKQKEQVLFGEGAIISPQIQIAQEITGEEVIKTVPFDTFIYEIKEGVTSFPAKLSSDFVSVLVDKLSDNNNFGVIQSAQESQFEFEFE